MTKGQMRSIEAILAVLLILMAYSRITGSLYEASSPVRSLSLKADRILRTLKETGLLSKSIREYDFKQASFLVSQILPIQYQHTLSTTFYVPIEIKSTGWTNSSFDKCRNIELKGGSSKLEGFPYYIKLDKDNDMQDDYEDLRFYSKPCSSGGEELDYEIGDYNSNFADIFVKIPSLSASGRTISVYYDNNTEISAGEDPAGAWNSNYKMVQHLEETSGTHYDSTQYDNDGTPYGGVTQDATGKVNGADDFDGSDDYVETNQNLMDNATSFTYSTWIKTSTFPSTSRVIGKEDVTLWGVTDRDTGQTIELWMTDPGGWTTSYYPGENISSGEWVHIGITWEGSTQELNFYIDGELSKDSPLTTGTTQLGSSTDQLSIGAREDGSQPYTGTIDEVRISNKTRSQAWINLSYQVVESQDSYVNLKSENQINVFLTRNIPGYVDSASISVSSENYTLPTCVTENWKAIPITIWSESNMADKKIKIPQFWMNVSSPNEVNLTSPTFYLRGEETELNYTKDKVDNSSYKINLTIKADRLKQGSNNGIFYYAYGKTLENEKLTSFESSDLEPPVCPPTPTETCYSREPIRKASRFDILFKSFLRKNLTQELYLTYSYGTNEERSCSWDRTGFLNQNIEIEAPDEKMVESTRPPSAKPPTISHSSSIFLSLEERRAEVTLEIWSQLV